MKLFLNGLLVVLLSIGLSEADAANWSYANPAAWGKQFSECSATGQSPIDFNSRRSQFTQLKRAALHVMMGHYPARVVNSRQQLVVTFPGERPEFALGRNYYHVLQFQFHSPSEHTLNGKQFPAELQIMLSEAGSKVDVALGVWLSRGRANPIIGALLRRAPHRIGAESAKFDFNARDFKRLLPVQPSYFQYTGTLTMPPCTRVKRWLVFRNPVTISSNQLKTLHSFYTNNYRPTQDLQGRRIYLAQ